MEIQIQQFGNPKTTKYMPDEARLLKAYDELPESIRLNEGIDGEMDDHDDNGDANDYVHFEDEDIDRIWDEIRKKSLKYCPRPCKYDSFKFWSCKKKFILKK